MDHDQVSQFERRQRHLPHWEEPGATYFVTFTLRRPAAVDLTRPEFGRLILEALHFRDGKAFWLYDYTVMPDHVHAIIKPIVREGRTQALSRIMQSLKSWLTRKINALSGRSGRLWEEETYDHIIRHERDYQELAGYILQNPHDAGLIGDPTEWPWWGKGSGPL